MVTLMVMLKRFGADIMNKYQKTIIVVLTILTIINIASASTISTVYTEGDLQGQNGQDVKVKIMASGMSNVGTVAVALTFDNSVLSVNSIADGNVKTPDAFSTSNVNNAQGLVAMGLGNPSGINGDGTLFIINFKVLGHVGDTSNLKLSITANDISGNVIDTTSSKIINGKFIVIGSGGEGLIEPYDNVLKHEIKERSISAAPTTFTYSTPELAIYEVVLTSTQSETALLRIDALKDTSKLVGMSAPGNVYKNINLWIDYKKVQNVVMRFKVENSWINNIGLSANKIKMSKWDHNKKRSIELLTNQINKDDNYTYFESQTDSIPASFAINAVSVIETPQITATVVQTPIPPQSPGQNDNNETGFKISMLVYPSAFKAESYKQILDKLENNNVTRIIVPVYDAKKGKDIHIYHTDTKGLNVTTTNSYSLDTLLTEAHSRGIEVYVRIASFGPDPVKPNEEQKQNLKKIINHLLDNYADNKGNKIDGIFLDHIYYEEPLSADGNTDIMANFVSDLNKEIRGRTKLSASVKPAYYESLLHIYLWPYVWPISGPSDYYNVVQYRGQDYVKLSKNLNFISPVSYNADHNYAGKITKFIKEKAGNSTIVIPNIQGLGETNNPTIQYAIDSAKNNGAQGVNVFDYSSLSDSEWKVIKST